MLATATGLLDTLVKQAVTDRTARLALADLLEDQGRYGQADAVRLSRESTQHTYHIRWAIRRDLVNLLPIEQERFDLGLSRKVLTEEDYLGLLRPLDQIGVVAELGEQIIGMMGYKLQRDSLILLHLTASPVHPGAISTMMAKLKSKLSSRWRTNIRTEVWPDDAAMRLMFLEQGFQEGKRANRRIYLRYRVK